MGVLDWLNLGFNVVTSGFSAWGNAEAKKSQYKANAAEAKYNISQLDLQLDRLLEEFNENQDSLEFSLGSTLRSNAQGLRTTATAQANALTTASTANTANQALMYANLAAVQRQGMLSVGSAVMGAATSGFRNTGSVAANVSTAREEASRAYDQTRQQVMISSYQSYMQAANDYFSSNAQLEAYRQSSRNAQVDFSLKSSALQNQYEYNKKRTEAEKEYWEGVKDSNETASTSGRQYFLDLIGGL